MSWFHKDKPNTGTGQPNPDERSLPAKIVLAFLTPDGEKIRRKKPPKSDGKK
jgi:hypothetical protein